MPWRQLLLKFSIALIVKPTILFPDCISSSFYHSVPHLPFLPECLVVSPYLQYLTTSLSWSFYRKLPLLANSSSTKTQPSCLLFSEVVPDPPSLCGSIETALEFPEVLCHILPARALSRSYWHLQPQHWAQLKACGRCLGNVAKLMKTFFPGGEALFLLIVFL